MSIDIKAPSFPESIAEGTIAAWHKEPGDGCQRDEVIVEIETDKVVLEVVAPADGTLEARLKEEGDTVESEEVVGRLAEGAAKGGKQAGSGSPAAAEPEADATAQAEEKAEAEAEREARPAAPASPAARKLAEEHQVALERVAGTGKDGRVTKDDVRRHVEAEAAPQADSSAESEGSPAAPAAEAPASPATERPRTGPELERIPGVGIETEERPERRVPMTRLRASIARRLVEAQQTAAMLTTFNEVDMKPIMDLRARHQERFQQVHNGTKLGFMSFFVRASTEALKRFPAVNASIDGNDVIYHGYYDIGVAVSTERGLVVPVIRDADGLSLAQIEEQINDFGTRARDAKLTLEEMTGGTFTISNGGIFGSLLSTPILNPPQTAILGMHKIQERPMAIDGEVVVRPMMYLAVSYDHRLIDGQEAVRFLVTIKELLEDPSRILLEI